MTLSNYANSHSELCHVEFHQWRCFCVKNNSWGKHKSRFLKRFCSKPNTHSLEKKILFNLIYSGVLQNIQTWSNNSLLSDATASRTKMKTGRPFSRKKLKLRIPLDGQFLSEKSWMQHDVLFPGNFSWFNC